ncbi:unnamed protein product, partial [Ectocarpus sp. 8 AP-2014]
MRDRPPPADSSSRQRGSCYGLRRGRVMGANEAAQVDGETFDRVYSIEVEGVGGYNSGQNPFVAAQNFSDKNELPQSYLNDITDHLTKRAAWTLAQQVRRQRPVSAASATPPASRTPRRR